jgi:hypothetical protein
MEHFWDKKDKYANPKYISWCQENPNGYVFNYFKGTDKSNKMNVIHKVNCNKLNARGKSTSYEKVCSNSKIQLEIFADEERGKNRWIKCGVCIK